MKGISTKQILLAATGIGAVVSAPVYAQSASADAGDIVVTARRVEEKLQDVPISMTVFTQEQVTNRNIVTATDLATYTPSLTANTRFGSEKASFIIRGFVQDQQTQPSVGVYFADVVGPRSGGSTPGGNGVGVGNLFDLQNIQVLKGPQGTLFGRNTTGGAVLLVPRKPTDSLEGYIEGSLGNYDMKRLQAVVNIPLADTFKVRLGVDRQKRDGYLINHSGIGPNALADVNYLAARLSIVADLTPDLENYTVASYTKTNGHGITFRIAGCDPTRVPNPAANAAPAYGCRQVARQQARGDGWWDVESNEPDPRSDMKTWQVINTTTWRASDTLTIKNIVSYSQFQEITRMSLSGDNYINADGTRGPSQTRLGNNPGYHMADQETITEEIQFQGGSSDGTFNWQAGGYFENSDPLAYTSQNAVIGLNCANSLAFQCNAAPPLTLPGAGLTFTNTISNPFQKTWFRNRGIYAQATYKLTEQLSLTGGARYTWDTMRHLYEGTAIGFPAANTPVAFCSNTVRVRYPVGTAAPTNPNFNFPVKLPAPGVGHEACGVTFEAKSHKPTWLIDLDYKPNDDMLLYAKYARGYRAGGVASANIYFEQWEPEKVDTYEVGAKTSFRGPVRGYFNVAGFYNDFSNQQVQHSLLRSATSPLLGGSAILNAGKSRIWGVELDSSVTLFDSLRIDGGYTYLNTKLLELDPVVLTPEQQLVWASVLPTSRKGGPLALSPKHRWTLGVTYTLPLDDSIGKISFGGNWVHTASQIASTATAVQFQVLPKNDLFSLNANWNDVLGAPIDLSFFMTNVTKEKFPLAVANSWPSYGYETQLPNEPRMWGFRLKYRFGD